MTNQSNDLLRIKEELTRHKEAIAASSIKEDFPEQEQAKEYNLLLMDAILEAFNDDEERNQKNVEKVAELIGKMAMDVDYSLDRAIGEINEIRHEAWHENKEHLLSIGIPAEAILQFSEIYNPLFDQFIHQFCKMFTAEND